MRQNWGILLVMDSIRRHDYSHLPAQVIAPAIALPVNRIFLPVIAP
jgi:hypothetical protein